MLVSVLDIEFVPDVVKWTHADMIYNLEIEFEDTDLFTEAMTGQDVDMVDKNVARATRRCERMITDEICPTHRVLTPPQWRPGKVPHNLLLHPRTC